MADEVQTFKAVCRGGLNTTGDVLSQGEETPGSATKLLNYEPDLQGGYRRISGFAHSFGTVTGTGSVLGLAVADGINQGVLGCRKPSSGNNYLHWFNYYYTFNVGADTNLSVGETLSERSDAADASTATGVTGTLVSKSSNTIVVNFGRLPSSVFTNGNYISDDSFSTNTNISSAPSVVGWTAVSTSGSPTMTSVSKVRFTRLNFGSPKVILTDGINPAATYDGSSYTQITDSNAPTDPVISEVFSNHLFLAGDPAKKDELFFSAPLAETDFTPANGAGSFNVGFDIVAIKVFRNILYIFGTNNIKRLVGNNREDFVLENVTNNLGCLATDSVLEIGGDLVFLAPDGIRPIGGTAKIGDVNLETVSKKIHKTVQNMIATETLSGLSAVLIRSKSQFRYMFSGTTSVGLLGALRENPQGGGFSFEFATLFGITVTCADSGYIDTDEVIIHGDSNGKVYAQESGTSFAGSNILSIYQTPYLYFGDPRRRKNFYDVSTYLRAEGTNSLSLGIVYDFDDTDVATPANVSIANTSPAAVFGSAIYDTTQIYDGNPAPVETKTFTGSGKSISFKFVAEDTNAAHSIQGFTVTFGLGDVR